MLHNAWRFLETGRESAIFHMALDTVLADRVARGRSGPVFRLYSWAGPAVTFGYSQKIHHIIDSDRCTADGVELARRPTGGRAVFHDDDLAYTIAVPLDHPLADGSVAGTCAVIARVLAEALVVFGVPAEVARTPAVERDVPGRVSPCFSSAGRNEIICHGRKIVGSAQRRMAGVMLQQGTIMLGAGFRRLSEYARDERTAEAWHRGLMGKAVSIAELTGNAVDRATLAGAVAETMGRRFGMPRTPSLPGDDERTDAIRLMQAVVPPDDVTHERGGR